MVVITLDITVTGTLGVVSRLATDDLTNFLPLLAIRQPHKPTVIRDLINGKIVPLSP